METLSIEVTESKNQSADIFTKSFVLKEKWTHARDMIATTESLGEAFKAVSRGQTCVGNNPAHVFGEVVSRSEPSPEDALLSADLGGEAAAAAPGGDPQDSSGRDPPEQHTFFCRTLLRRRLHFRKADEAHLRMHGHAHNAER